MFLLAAITLAVGAIGAGFLHSQYSDPESYTPAPLLGFFAFFSTVVSLIFRHRAKGQNIPARKWTWLYRLGGMIVIAIILWVIVSAYSFWHCASNYTCHN